jgi:hypothetical protein
MPAILQELSLERALKLGERVSDRGRLELVFHTSSLSLRIVARTPAEFAGSRGGRRQRDQLVIPRGAGFRCYCGALR